jgi:signal peptide peptidase SppA
MTKLWCGSQESYDLVLAAEAKATAFMAGKDSGVTLDDLLPPMYSRVGDVGVVHIAGPLVSGDAGFMRLFGVTGYDNVREAVIQALGDKEAKSVMLSIDSPGGAVSGVTDASRFIKAAAQIKPMSAYAETIASAAYWLGANAGHITVSDASLVGSVGVLTVHTEVSKMNEKDGITRTVLRAGEYKALGNPHEPLSAEAEASIKSQLEYLYGLFADSVAEARGTSRASFDATMGRGREFIGQQAVTIGLADAVGTYEDALAMASGKKTANRGKIATKAIASIAESHNNATIQTEGPDVKPTLTPEQMLAIQAGINEESSATSGSAEGEANKADAAATVEAVTAELATAKAELDTTKAQLADATAAVEAGKQAATDAGELINSFAAIVSASTKSMLIALGSNTDVLASIEPKALLAKHAEVSDLFKTKFKAGGVAATSASATEESKPAKASIDPLFAAAVKFATTK